MVLCCLELNFPMKVLIGALIGKIDGLDSANRANCHVR